MSATAPPNPHQAWPKGPRGPRDENWTRSERFHNSFLLKPDAGLEHALKTSEENGLPNIIVGAAEGKMLYLAAKSVNAKRILEIGTLGGYSAIFMGRALGDGGRIITCEVNEKHAEVARANFEFAGLADKIEVRLGPAAETLKTLSPDEPFDLVFIDADKESNPLYYKEARRLTRKGAVIIVDNMVQGGRIADLEQTGPGLEGARELLRLLKEDSGVEASTIAMVGERGYDGFTYIVVL